MEDRDIVELAAVVSLVIATVEDWGAVGGRVLAEYAQGPGFDCNAAYKVAY